VPKKALRSAAWNKNQLSFFLFDVLNVFMTIAGEFQVVPGHPSKAGKGILRNALKVVQGCPGMAQR
jgi:hypothetical protein